MSVIIPKKKAQKTQKATPPKSPKTPVSKPLTPTFPTGIIARPNNEPAKNKTPALPPPLPSPDGISPDGVQTREKKKTREQQKSNRVDAKTKEQEEKKRKEQEQEEEEKKRREQEQREKEPKKKVPNPDEDFIPIEQENDHSDEEHSDYDDNSEDEEEYYRRRKHLFADKVNDGNKTPVNTKQHDFLLKQSHTPEGTPHRGTPNAFVGTYSGQPRVLDAKRVEELIKFGMPVPVPSALGYASWDLYFPELEKAAMKWPQTGLAASKLSAYLEASGCGTTILASGRTTLPRYLNDLKLAHTSGAAGPLLDHLNVFTIGDNIMASFIIMKNLYEDRHEEELAGKPVEDDHGFRMAWSAKMMLSQYSADWKRRLVKLNSNVDSMDLLQVIRIMSGNGQNSINQQQAASLFVLDPKGAEHRVAKEKAKIRCDACDEYNHILADCNRANEFIEYHREAIEARKRPASNTFQYCLFHGWCSHTTKECTRKQEALNHPEKFRMKTFKPRERYPPRDRDRDRDHDRNRDHNRDRGQPPPRNQYPPRERYPPRDRDHDRPPQDRPPRDESAREREERDRKRQRDASYNNDQPESTTAEFKKFMKEFQNSVSASMREMQQQLTDIKEKNG